MMAKDEVMAVRVLCTGDIHIGRSASKVPDAYRCSHAWTSIVDLAISERVDLLAISGDIVDKENKSFEAIGPLQDGLRRLSDAGIDTVAIAGNHDHDVLSRLLGNAGTDRFHLLGQDGVWERWTLSRNGSAQLHVCGWSFPKEHVRENPLHSFVDSADDGVPVLGLLHGEVATRGAFTRPCHSMISGRAVSTSGCSAISTHRSNFPTRTAAVRCIPARHMRWTPASLILTASGC